MIWLQCGACRIAGITLILEMGSAGLSALDAIRKLSADYETAHLAGDGQALARLFGDDAVIIPPGKPAIEGRKRIDEFFSGVTGGTGLKTETLRIEVHGSIAYAYGTNS